MLGLVPNLMSSVPMPPLSAWCCLPYARAKSELGSSTDVCVPAENGSALSQHGVPQRGLSRCGPAAHGQRGGVPGCKPRSPCTGVLAWGLGGRALAAFSPLPRPLALQSCHLSVAAGDQAASRRCGGAGARSGAEQGGDKDGAGGSSAAHLRARWREAAKSDFFLFSV